MRAGGVEPDVAERLVLIASGVDETVQRGRGRVRGERARAGDRLRGGAIVRPLGERHGTQEESDERMWAIVDYMYYLAGLEPSADDAPPEAPYKNRMTAVATDEEIDLSRGQELFADAPASMFPLFGQIVEPGRNFHPSFYAVTARAIYNDDEVAFMVTWNDMRAETEAREADLRGQISQDYLERMKRGLQHWVDGGSRGYLAWGIFHFQG